ncbi:hypothetical protein KJ797_02940, partial [Patescibacteria group bacterium]|nr:hypothetical protein [Patescibacteria group bacterium]
LLIFLNYMKIAIIIMSVLILFGLGGIIFKLNQANGVLRGSLGQASQQLIAAKQEWETQKTVLNEAQNSLKEVQGNLGEKDKLYSNLNIELNKLKSNLASTTNAWQSADENLKLADEKITKFKDDLAMYNSSIYYTLTRLGVGATNQDLAKIPTANYNFAGYDSDGDGLSDAIERALGTDPTKADSDDDGYNDKAEIVGDFNPNGAGNLTFDSQFADKQKGKILLQVQSKGEAWYINLADGKKYFFGLPSAAIKVLESAGL